MTSHFGSRGRPQHISTVPNETFIVIYRNETIGPFRDVLDAMTAARLHGAGAKVFRSSDGAMVAKFFRGDPGAFMAALGKTSAV